MTVLSTQTLRERIYGLQGGKGDIHVTPILDPARQVANSAVDIRLGRHFIVARPTMVDSFDILQDKAQEDIDRFQEHLFIDFGRSLVLQAGSCALGSVLEYISLPRNVYAEVVTRSSWGRLDLTIATAVGVHPGYSGCLTLELENMGAAPIRLYPGARVGQLVFHQVDEEDVDSYRGRKYPAPTRPQYTRVHSERDEVLRFSELARVIRGEAGASVDKCADDGNRLRQL